MNKGQGERLQIVTYNPVRRFINRVIVLGLIVALVAGGYFLWPMVGLA